MAYRTRIKYTDEQKSEMWDRWKRGESLKEIGRAFDRGSSSIYGQLSPTGGIRPVPRIRSGVSLMLSEREEISRGIAAKHSMRWIASSLDRSSSTISREVKRNGGVDSYRTSRADQSAWDRAHRPKACKLAMNGELRDAVAIKLELEWSPQQIAGWLKHEYPADESREVSHETIYRTLFTQARGALKKELHSIFVPSARSEDLSAPTNNKISVGRFLTWYRSGNALPQLRIELFRATGKVI